MRLGFRALEVSKTVGLPACGLHVEALPEPQKSVKS